MTHESAWLCLLQGCCQDIAWQGQQCERRVQGTSFGAPCELENVLAKMVIERVPCVEMVRFVNSGTEACLSVLRLMRAYTKRDKVLTCPTKLEVCLLYVTTSPLRMQRQTETAMRSIMSKGLGGAAIWHATFLAAFILLATCLIPFI